MTDQAIDPPASADAPRTRRALLIGAIGGAAALAAATLGRPAPAWAADGQPVTIGQSNTGTTGTILTRTAGDAFTGSTAATSAAGIVGLHTGVANGGFGVRGSTSSMGGTGVAGIAGAATGSAAGVSGTSISPTGYGVYGDMSSATGVNAGVFGHSSSSSGRGVLGRATASSGADAIGVEGFTNSPAGAGVKAINQSSGVALRVQGQVTFSTAGLVHIGAGSRSAQVGPGVDISNSSKVLAMLQSNGGTGVGVLRITRNPTANTFTILLNADATQTCTVAWFVIS